MKKAYMEPATEIVALEIVDTKPAVATSGFKGNNGNGNGGLGGGQTDKNKNPKK